MKFQYLFLLTTLWLSLIPQARSALVTLAPALPGSTLIDFNSAPPSGSVSWPADKVFTATQLPFIAKPLPDGTGGFLVSSKPNEPGGVTSVTFGGDVNYLGLTWGSPDIANTLRFYRLGVPVDFVTGAMVPPSNGNQALSPHVSITGVLFDRVDMESSTYNFEADNFSFIRAGRTGDDPGTPSVPEGGAGLAALAGLMGLGAVIRSRRK